MKKFLGLLALFFLAIPFAQAQQGPVISSVQVATSGNVAAATATATLPAVAGRTTVLTEMQITGAGATAGSCVNATVTGLVGGTLNYTVCAPAGATTSISPVIVTFGDYGLLASGQNTPVVATLPSLGAGNTNAAVNLTGYYQ